MSSPLDRRPPVASTLYKPAPPIVSQPLVLAKAPSTVPENKSIRSLMPNADTNYSPLAALVYEKDPVTQLPVYCVPEGHVYALPDYQKEHRTLRVGKNARLNLPDGCFKLTIIADKNAVIGLGKYCSNLIITSTADDVMVLPNVGAHNVIVNGIALPYEECSGV